MASHPVTVVPGDGIGPEVVAAARRVVDATGVEIEWDEQPAGSPLPAALLESIRETRVALKGPVATPPGSRSPNIALRDELGLRVGIRPSRSLAGAPSPAGTMDVVVARMTAGDLYAGIEFSADSEQGAAIRAMAAIPGDAAIALKPISATESDRAARAAFAWARDNGRRRVTVVHKATVMPVTDGAFLEAARAAAADFPELEVDDRLVDAVCHDLVARPSAFDVLLTTMLYGDLLSDLCAGLTGGLGLAPGANLGDGCAVFEAVHGTAMRHSGKDRANPMAMILTAAMMLRHLGEADAALRVEAAVAGVVAAGRAVSYDLRPGRAADGASGTEAVADAVIAALGEARSPGSASS